MADPLAPYRGKSEWRTPSNAISLSRVGLAVPAAIAVWTGSNRIAGLLFILAFITDLLDGYVARRTGDITELGKVIDPLADKIFVGTIVVVMVVRGMLPVWFVAAVLIRDLLIFAGGVWATRKFKVVLPSNYPGKAAVFFISLTLLLTVFGAGSELIRIAQIISLVLMAVSLALYANRLRTLVRQTSAA